MIATTALPITIPVDVLRYCESRGLLADLYAAFRTAEEAYAPVKRWQIALEPDPEVEDEYVVIEVATTGELDELLRKQEEFALHWSSAATPEATWRIRVLWKIP